MLHSQLTFVLMRNNAITDLAATNASMNKAAALSLSYLAQQHKAEIMTRLFFSPSSGMKLIINHIWAFKITKIIITALLLPASHRNRIRWPSGKHKDNTTQGLKPVWFMWSYYCSFHLLLEYCPLCISFTFGDPEFKLIPHTYDLWFNTEHLWINHIRKHS